MMIVYYFSSSSKFQSSPLRSHRNFFNGLRDIQHCNIHRAWHRCLDIFKNLFPMYLSWFIFPIHRETLFSLAHFILIWSFSRVVITKICDPPVFISISHTRWRHWNYIKYFLSQLLTASGLGGELNGNSNDLEKKISSSTTPEVYFQQVGKTSSCE